MNASLIARRIVHVSSCCALGVWFTSVGLGQQTNSVETGPVVPPAEHRTDEDADRPAPVLPEEALLLGKYANLELTITANRDGSLQKVAISKPSKAKLYDEYTRDWVEKHWKMPPAKPDEPETRQFIAPIVYPAKPKRWPAGRHPDPEYPAQFIRAHIQGIVITEIEVAPSGAIDSVRTVVSSGHKELDAYTESWVRKHWRLEKGERRLLHWPVTYVTK